MTNEQPTYLPIREWLELGQALSDKSWCHQGWFNKCSTAAIRLGKGCSIKADGKTYRAGLYRLAPQ